MEEKAVCGAGRSDPAESSHCCVDKGMSVLGRAGAVGEEESNFPEK